MFRFRFLAPAILFDEPSEESQAQAAPGQAPEAQVPEAPAQETAQAGPFDENFDPTTLPEELRAGWNQLRGDYTRKTQTLAEQRREAEGALAFVQALQDPQTAPLALQALGVQIPHEGDEELYDPDNLEIEDPLEGRVAAMEFAAQQQALQAQQVEQQQAIESHIDTELDALEQRTGRSFTDRQLDALEALAKHNPDERGLPNVQGAFEHLFEGVLEDERRQWVASKKTITPPKGAPGSPEFDTSTTEGRVQHMAAIAQAAMERDAQT